MNLREIDRLVAEKVMGWKVGYSIGLETNVYNSALELGYPRVVDEWIPTKSIDDAWTVLDKFEDYELLGTPCKNDYRCKVKKDGKWFSAESSESSELVICLAALKAVGVDVE